MSRTANKVSLKYFLALLSLLAFALYSVKSNNRKWMYASPVTIAAEENGRDTIPKTQRKDTVNAGVKTDTSIVVQKSDTFNIKFSKDSLDGPITYEAEDSMVWDVPTNRIILYGKKARTVYEDNELTAPIIELNQETGNVTAAIKRDSAGNVIAFPTFKQGDFLSQSDSIKFNLKTKKGLTKSTYTQQGEMYVYGEVIKKVSDDIFYAKRARFTTCNLDTPHFAFISNKIKFINKKVAISGPVHPEFEGVPIPIYLPFGIYPLNQNRHSGFMAPNFTANEQLGLGIENGGYYKIIGSYWDLILRGNLYSYGGWKVNINPRYSRKYRYNGSIGLDIQHFNYNTPGDPDFTQNKSFNIQWSHSMDLKARPGVSFNANVNAGSSSYNAYVPDNPYKNFSNQLTSSIVYSKSWKDKPYNLTISANHNQNSNLKLINVNLPDVAFTATTVYPFRKKDMIGTPKWYENLGIGYNGNAKSLFSFYDTTSNIFRHIGDTLQWGAHHSVPISLSLPQIGAFQLSPAVSYDETWYQRKFIRSWNDVTQKVDTSIAKGFYTARQMSFGLNLSTRIFGLLASKKKNSKFVALRHEVRPTIGLNYRPDMNGKDYYTTQVDATGRTQTFSVFDNNIFSPYGKGRFGGLNFGIDNNLQLKLRNKRDTSENAVKKITIFDALGINSSYNFFADSFKLSPFNLSARSNLFNKISLSAGAIIDPYETDSTGRDINKYIWKRKFSLGRITSGNISLSGNFQGGNKKASTKKTDLLTNDYAKNNNLSLDELNQEINMMNANPAQFADFDIPWSLNVSYSLTFFKRANTDYSGFTTEVSQNTMVNGTLSLTPKWQINYSTSYNITDKQLGMLSVGLSREMHCWQMSIQLSPVGHYKFFSINISPKSALLRDLRINRTRSFFDL